MHPRKLFAHERTYSSRHEADIPSAGSVALIAGIALPILSVILLVAACLALVAWPFAPGWAYIAQRRKVRDVREQDAKRSMRIVQAGAYPGEPGCSVIAALDDELLYERSRGLLVEQVTNKEAHRRMGEYLAWINARRADAGKEQL